jgi:hypothetical protein
MKICRQPPSGNVILTNSLIVEPSVFNAPVINDSKSGSFSPTLPKKLSCKTCNGKELIIKKKYSIKMPIGWHSKAKIVMTGD